MKLQNQIFLNFSCNSSLLIFNLNHPEKFLGIWLGGCNRADVFCFLSSLPLLSPATHHGSVQLQPVISLLLTNTVAPVLVYDDIFLKSLLTFDLGLPFFQIFVEVWLRFTFFPQVFVKFGFRFTIFSNHC